ncbi:hypothetical protein [Amycolatopsis thermoflava]|uniref:hypothetical protein n=1 Tax=Amycolatopsis thermoflava TaxID=84480 RepID=UPI0004819D26|nr:hypothetical protein [Amycolatopsis thermoflava]
MTTRTPGMAAVAVDTPAHADDQSLMATPTAGTVARLWPWLRPLTATATLTRKVGTGAFRTGLELIDSRSDGHASPKGAR